MWALIFITFINFGNGDFSFETSKNPYLLKTAKECEQLLHDIRMANPSDKWDGMCFLIDDNNTRSK